MEAALSIPFFDSKILFSLTFETYEKQLKQELMMCHKHVGFTLTELMKMTVNDRRNYIRIHNRQVEEEKRRHEFTMKRGKR